jgi:hypothetical protein
MRVFEKWKLALPVPKTGKYLCAQSYSIGIGNTYVFKLTLNPLPEERTVDANGQTKVTVVEYFKCRKLINKFCFFEFEVAFRVAIVGDFTGALG